MATAIDDVITCAVCFETYRDPQVLPCHHSFCRVCVDKMSKGSKVQCPKCMAFADLSRVKPDFNYHKIQAALQQKQNEMLQNVAAPVEPTATPLTGASGDTSQACDLCETNVIAHLCQDCSQWLCENCKRIHLRIAATKSHSVTSLVKKQAAIRKRREQELKLFKAKATEYDSAIQKRKTTINDTKKTQANLLSKCADMKADCKKDIDAFFASLQNQINNFTDKTLKELQGNLQTIQVKSTDINQGMVEFSQSNFAGLKKGLLGGDDVSLMKAKAYLQSLTPPNVDNSPPVMMLTRNSRWKDVEAATLTTSATAVSTDSTSR